MRRRSSPRRPLDRAPLALLVLLACPAPKPDPATTDAPASSTGAPPDATGPQPTTDTPDPTGDTSTTTSTTTAATTTTGDDPSATTSPADSDSLELPDVPREPLRCDPLLQDCPDGRKCTIVGDAFGCVPIPRDPVGPGEPCVDLGEPDDGLDTCPGGQACWKTDPATGEGACVDFCTGDYECGGGKICVLDQGGFPALCASQCNPLAQDCPGAELCALYELQAGGPTFVCVLDGSGAGGQVFDPCDDFNACDPGLACVQAALAAECDPDAGRCCLPFCDQVAPPDCPGAGQKCQPLDIFGFPTVGLCGQ